MESLNPEGKNDMRKEAIMRISRLSQDILGFQIISLTNGEVIGKVEDVLLDLDKCQIGAVVTSKGNPLVRKIEAVHRSNVEVWGVDVILVNKLDVIRNVKKLKKGQNWQMVTSELRGKNILNMQGEKFAELNDVVIDSEGQVIGYDLSKVLIGGSIEETKRIHANATQAFGKDALIIDMDRLYRWEIKEAA
jgi:uncharacterized protein YrrD